MGRLSNRNGTYLGLSQAWMIDFGLMEGRSQAPKRGKSSTLGKYESWLLAKIFFRSKG
jgi:hypothetical protein